jgi:hypothetical protein
MQFHQGLRLKNFIENSKFKVKDISEKSGVALSSLYDLYKKNEILKSRLEPILNAIEVDLDTFYGVKSDLKESKSVTESLKREIELLKQQLQAKDEIIDLLKNKTKTTKQ